MVAPFRMKSFQIQQDRCAMKVGTDAILLGTWAAASAPHTVLDIGTGTGILALMLAQRFPTAQVHAVEIEASAGQQAQENFAASPFASRLHVHLTPVQQFATATTFDLIVCNPPYFENSLRSANANRNTARHNASLSLTDLATAVRRLLAPGGRFCLILPADTAAEFGDVAGLHGLFPEQQCLVRPTPTSIVKRHLLSFVQKPPSTVRTTELVVEISRHQYSDAYRRLAREFLLKL